MHYIFCAYSVSYTHLDVYKRQLFILFFYFSVVLVVIREKSPEIKVFPRQPARQRDSNRGCNGPVSYTHIVEDHKNGAVRIQQVGQYPVIEVKRKLMLPLFAHSRHIALPPVFVYGFGAIFGKITAIEPPKISRSISDRVDYPPIRLSCFGIISVSVRQFSPVSFLP